MSALAQRYAAALADVAFEHKDADKIRRDLSDFAEVFGSSAELRNLLSNPSVSADAKKSVTGQIANRMGAHEEIGNFLFILIDHGRMAMIQEIRRSFEDDLNRRLGIVEAFVISAHELSPDEKSRLTQSLERVTHKKIQAQYRLNPELIGGATVRIGSTIYDGSVREQLKRLRTQLEAQ